MNESVSQLDLVERRQLARFVRNRPRILQSHPRINLWELVAHTYYVEVGHSIPNEADLTPICRARELRVAGKEMIHLPTLEFYLRLDPVLKRPFARAMRAVDYVMLNHEGVLTDVGSLRGLNKNQRQLLDIAPGLHNSEFLEKAF